MTTAARSQVLYITYDGLLEPLGQSQVLAYMEKLAPEWPVHILSFEKSKDRDDEARMAAMRARLRAAGIGWTPLAYHKSPSAPATAYDIAVGTLVALRLVLRLKVKIVHARSYVPALVALAVKRVAGVKFLFDMRGFWADERVDGGLWPKNGRLYRIAKDLERRFLEAADHVVTLTNAGAREIARFPYLKDRMPPLSVIPTCADLNLFRPGPDRDDSVFTFGYVGSVGTWYLFDETLAFFRVIAERKPDARLLVVNRNEHEAIRTAVQKAGIEHVALRDRGCAALGCAKIYCADACRSGDHQALIFQDCQRTHQTCGISWLRRAMCGQCWRWRHGGDFGRKTSSASRYANLRQPNTIVLLIVCSHSLAIPTSGNGAWKPPANAFRSKRALTPTGTSI